MGNALRFLYGQCCSGPPATAITGGGGGGGVSGLEQDIHHFEVNFQGLLSFYGLPHPHSLVEFPEVLKFKLHTLPVDPKAVAHGDSLIVYVSTSCPRESSRVGVPEEIQMKKVARNEARDHGKYKKANALHKQIKDAGYGVLCINNKEILARKYRIRLRGIYAPKQAMPYAKEANEELANIVGGKCLKILVFYKDRHERWVADVYCDDIFVQEEMLRKGFAWHYKAYDKRPEFEKWEKDARAMGDGLWDSSNPG